MNIELIEAIARLVVLAGEAATKLIPQIVELFCPDHSDEDKSKYHEEIKKKIGK